MLKKLISLVVSLGIICSLVVLPVGTAYAEEWGEYNNEDGYYHISNADQLVALSEATKTEGHPTLTYKYMLDNDIIIPATYKSHINIASNSEHPFAGTFDGNGHTIYNFDSAGGITGGANSGLFAFTKGATIRNLTIDGADVDSVMVGGILVSQAIDSNIYNITIKNSNLQIVSGGSVITLITSGGAMGGAIAGAVQNSTLYNCEANYTNVYVHNGEGITALAGDGYYLGGLVGELKSSTLEYSRAIGDGVTRGNGSTYIDSNIAVGLLSGKIGYVGGLVGIMEDDSSIIDSFCSTYLKSEMVVDVPLLAGADVQVGGIVSRINDGNNNLIERCHYSGLIESQALATNNVNLGGIASYVDMLDTPITRVQIKDCFYNWEKAVGEKKTPLIPVIQPVYGYIFGNPDLGEVLDSEQRITIENSTLKADTDYSDVTNQWSPHGYDFAGTTQRTSDANVFLGGPHINQWVLDVENNMPVHGTTTMDIYSNYHNAFTESDAPSIEYQYTINDDQTVTVPELSAVEPLVEEENTKYAGYVGLAFVSEDSDYETISYSCDAVYPFGSKIPLDTVQEYSSDMQKRIYAVWCQGKTIGGQLNLSGSSGIRVLTAVNTKLLENIALDKPDDEYGRAVTFNNDPTTKYLIKADSRAWLGEQYVKAAGADTSEIDNARVFSIYLYLDENEYNTEINAVGDILLNDSSAEGKFIDYMCGGSFKSSATKIAEAYFNDLMAGDYQISDDAYLNLINYIPEIANEEIDMSSDMDFDQFDDAMPEAEAQADAE
ncbi:MAG: hypothetical protein ACLRQ0_06955 [Monoglobales bacterium]